MQTFWSCLGALILFAIGVRLSGFFSGSETGFYRASFLRLSIDAQGGDHTARRLIWFSQNPGYFVATTLVGNNVANYLTTIAIGLLAVALFPHNAGWLEIVATLAISPIVFVFGELMPKYLYYRAPLRLLRRDSRWFGFFYRIFYPASLPLVQITRLFERMGRAEKPRMELVLGRNRLVQVLSQGHREGLLTDVQSRLVHGVLHTAPQTVGDTATPALRVLGLAADCEREEILEFARSYGLGSVAIRHPDRDDDWYGYVRVSDLVLSTLPVASLIRSMPRIAKSVTRLEALVALLSDGEEFGVVHDGEQVVGTVSRHGLQEQLFRTPHLIGARPPVNM